MGKLPAFSEIRGTLAFLESWEDRFGYIIDLGKQLPALAESERVDASLVSGCQARVWLVAEPEDRPADHGRVIRFRAASDAHIVSGLIAVLMSIYDGRTPTEILGVDARSMVTELGLNEHLSPTRRNGLASMIDRIRTIASAVQSTSGAAASAG